MRRKRDEILIYRNILTIIYLALIVLFSYFCMQSGDDSSITSNSFSNSICYLFGITNTEQISSFIRKAIGHFGFFLFFGLISSFLYMTFYKLSYLKQIGIHFITGISFILMTEFLFQVIAINRGPSFMDCLIDFSGFLISSIIVLIFYFVIRYVRLNKIYDNNKIYLMFIITTGIIYFSLIIVYFILSGQSSKTSSDVGTSVAQTVVDITPGISGHTVKDESLSVQRFMRKVLGHFGYFAIMGFFGFLFFNFIKIKKKISIPIYLSLGIILALLSEYVIQNIASGRGASIKDSITDSLGYLITSLVLFLIFFIINNVLDIKYKHIIKPVY